MQKIYTADKGELTLTPAQRQEILNHYEKAFARFIAKEDQEMRTALVEFARAETNIIPDCPGNVQADFAAIIKVCPMAEQSFVETRIMAVLGDTSVAVPSAVPKDTPDSDCTRVATERKEPLNYQTFLAALETFTRWDTYVNEEDRPDLSKLMESVRGVVSFSPCTYEGNCPPETGQSKIGGIPHLPDAINWPEHSDRPMAFLAQFNLALIRTDTEKVLPKQGMLYFFIAEHDRMDWDEPARDEFAVRYFDGPVESLKPRAFPSVLTPAEQIEEQWIFFSDRIGFQVPQDISPNISGIEALMEAISCRYDRGGEMQFEDRDDHYDNQQRGFNQGRLLGTPDSLQDNVVGAWYGGYDDFMDDFLYDMDDDAFCHDPGEEETPGRYRLLFQCSGEDVGWGNVILYFGITEENLADKNFETVKLVVQGT